MLYRFQLLITLQVFCTSCLAVPIGNLSVSITKPKAIVFIDDKNIGVAGEGGCGIFDSTSQELMQTLSYNNPNSIASHKNIVMYIEHSLTFFDINTKSSHLVSFIHAKTPIAIGNNIAFCHTNSRLESYDYISKTYKSDISTNLKFTPEDYRLISCNPHNNNVLCPIDNDILTIIETDSEPTIKLYLDTNLTYCNGGEYSADGQMIAFNDNHNKYFIYDLADQDNIAYELSAHNKKYVAAAFHPHISLLALLSQDNVVQYWDYAAHKFVATTYPLACDTIDQSNLTKRLAFSPDGAHLAVALENKWSVIKAPHINLGTQLTLFWLFCHRNDIPQDIFNYIMQIFAIKNELSKIDGLSLSKIILLTHPSELLEKNDTLEGPETRSLKIKYATEIHK